MQQPRSIIFSDFHAYTGQRLARGAAIITGKFPRFRNKFVNRIYGHSSIPLVYGYIYISLYHIMAIQTVATPGFPAWMRCLAIFLYNRHTSAIHFRLGTLTRRITQQKRAISTRCSIQATIQSSSAGCKTRRASTMTCSIYRLWKPTSPG
jgi:hypothetical protein